MRHRILFLPLLAALMLAACNPSQYYASYEDVDPNGWNLTETLYYDFSVDDTLSSYNTFIDIRHTDAYPYANLFLFVKTSYPDGSQSLDTLECPLADPAGNWYGRVNARHIDSRHPLTLQLRFPMKGNYSLAITQGMRDTLLLGLTQVGFRVEKEPNQSSSTPNPSAQPN